MTARIIPFPQRQVEGEPWEPWVDEIAIARHFSASARTVRRWRAQGMPSEMAGGLRRYRLSACERWHRQRSGGAA